VNSESLAVSFTGSALWICSNKVTAISEKLVSEVVMSFCWNYHTSTALSATICDYKTDFQLTI